MAPETRVLSRSITSATERARPWSKKIGRLASAGLGNSVAAEASGVVPQAAVPVAPAPQATVERPVAATGATSLGTNQGYNAQTAVGGSEGTPSWLAGLGALAAAGAAVAFRRRSRPFTPAG